MAHPQDAQVPLDTIAETVSWLGHGEPADQSRNGNSRGTVFASTSGLERESVELAFEGATLRETPLSFNLAGSQVFGVLSEPVAVDVMGCLWPASERRGATPYRAEPNLGRDRPAVGRTRGADTPGRPEGHR